MASAKVVIAAIVAVALIIGIAVVFFNPQAEVDRLVIVVNPGVSARVSAAEAQELEKFLEEELGVDVELYYPLSTAALIEALKFEHAHVALGVGTLAASLAIKNADVEMVLAEYRSVIIDGNEAVAPYYYSYFIVLRDSPYTTLDELRGKKACFPSETSTSGFIMPMKLLVEKGYVKAEGVRTPRDLPQQFFGEVVFGGGYAQCWEALKKGSVDVTVMAGDVVADLYWEAMNNSRVLQLRDGSLAIAGPNPSHVVLIRRDLPPELKTRVVNTLLKLNERPDLMKKYVSAIFVRFEKRSTEEHLGPLLEALDVLGLADYYLGR
ncbi:MAG: phosphate/phosphite/phosphonate ABC transporter substrate-binding protein [Pyrobaculum sp.]